MLADSPSRTAFGAAMHRAAHQLIDRPLVFEDPLALRIVGADAEALLRSGDARWTSPLLSGLRAFVNVRSRYSEDCFAEAYAAGSRQFIGLGAGLDTFAFRGKFPTVQVFEVDHPATQRWKRELLERSEIPVPRTVTFVPVDFERQHFDDELLRADFDFERPAFVSWLGVTPYLDRDAVLDVLRACAHRLQSGSELVLDFASPPPQTPAARAVHERFAALVASHGEELKSAFDPRELATTVRAMGFSAFSALDHIALNERYFLGRADGLRLRYGHVARVRL